MCVWGKYGVFKGSHGSQIGKLGCILTPLCDAVRRLTINTESKPGNSSRWMEKYPTNQRGFSLERISRSNLNNFN